MKNRNPFETSQELESFCKSNDIAFLGVFGSYARGEESPTSDIDFLYEFKKDKKKTLFDLGRIQFNLEKKFNKSIDFVEANHIKPIIRESILNDLITIYAEKQ